MSIFAYSRNPKESCVPGAELREQKTNRRPGRDSLWPKEQL